MYARILKFLTNLLFKRIFRGFLTPRKKREPGHFRPCALCGEGFAAFNKRQRICKKWLCRKIYRARQYQARVDFAKGQRKANMEATQARERETAASIIGPTLESEE